MTEDIFILFALMCVVGALKIEAAQGHFATPIRIVVPLGFAGGLDSLMVPPKLTSHFKFFRRYRENGFSNPSDATSQWPGSSCLLGSWHRDNYHHEFN